MTEKLDMTVLTAALGGNDSAINQLVTQLTPVIQARVARRLLPTAGVRDVRQEVKDLTQDVFLHLFENDARVLRGWEAARGMSLENYVGLIAQRRAISSLRSGKSNPWRETGNVDDLAQPASAQTDIEREVIGENTLAAVLAAMQAQLSPMGWRLFELLYVEEKTVDEVRRITSMSNDAIYAWRSRLRKLARQCQRALADDSGSIQEQA